MKQRRRAGLAITAFGVAALTIVAVACTHAEDTDEREIKQTDAGTDGHVVLDGGGDPPVPPNGAEACPEGACNYQTNEGCTGATSCVPTQSGADQVTPSCQPAGAKTSGDACASQSECAPGFLCAEGECHKLCCGRDWTGCASDDEHCIRTLKVGATDTGAMLCYPVNTCDALAPKSCSDSGRTCQIVDPTGATACMPEGSGEHGEPCPCKGGFLCADEGSAEVCRRLCKAVEGGGEPYCQSGEGNCVHYTKHPAGVGECIGD